MSYVVYNCFLYNLFHFIIIQSADADHCSEFRSRVCGATLSKFAGQCQPHLQGPPACMLACLTNTVCLEILWNHIYPIFLYIHLWNNMKFIGTWTVWSMYVCMYVCMYIIHTVYWDDIGINSCACKGPAGVIQWSSGFICKCQEVHRSGGASLQERGRRVLRHAPAQSNLRPGHQGQEIRS